MPEPARRLVLVEPPPPRASSILPLEARGLVYEAGGRRLIDGVDLDPGARPAHRGDRPQRRRQEPAAAPAARPDRARRGRDPVARAGRPTAPSAPRQAMVFQKPVLLRRSVAANIDYALAARGLPGGRAPGARGRRPALGRLVEHATRPARVLSGGEQQRLALVARAGGRARDPVPRRADRQPRPGLDPGGRGADRGRPRPAAPASSWSPTIWARRAGSPTRSCSCIAAASWSRPRRPGSSPRPRASPPGPISPARSSSEPRPGGAHHAAPPVPGVACWP